MNMNIDSLKQTLFENYEDGLISDDDLIQIIEQAAEYLNLKTMTNTANFRNKSYNGIKKFAIHDIIIDKVKFYKNND